jgi:hypothetical protein
VLASTTEGGLDTATRGLAIEYDGRGIRVNVIARAHHQDFDARAGDLRGVGEVSDIAQAVLSTSRTPAS